MSGRWHGVVRGVRLGGRVLGVGPTTVALMHGGASNHRWWDPVARLLAARRYRVIWWDHRGHGDSDPGACTVDELADDALAVLAEFGAEDAVLVGHSAGAAVALAAAARSRAAAVGCVEGGVYDPRLLFGATWERARPAMISGRRGRVTDAILRAWLAQAGLPPTAFGAVAGNYAPTGDGGLRLRLAPDEEERLAYSAWTQDLTALLPAIDVPVLVVAAGNNAAGDTAAGDTAAAPRRESILRARRLLAGPLLEEWVPGGHDLPLQRPDPVAAAIARLVAATAAPPAGERRRQYAANERIGIRGPKRGAPMPATSRSMQTRPR